jgi:hypothetical protein
MEDTKGSEVQFSLPLLFWMSVVLTNLVHVEVFPQPDIG